MLTVNCNDYLEKSIKNIILHNTLKCTVIFKHLTLGKITLQHFVVLLSSVFLPNLSQLPLSLFFKLCNDTISNVLLLKALLVLYLHIDFKLNLKNSYYLYLLELSCFKFVNWPLFDAFEQRLILLVRPICHRASLLVFAL